MKQVEVSTQVSAHCVFSADIHLSQSKMDNSIKPSGSLQSTLVPAMTRSRHTAKLLTRLRDVFAKMGHTEENQNTGPLQKIGDILPMARYPARLELDALSSRYAADGSQ